jgi:hypothetical protein
VKGLSVLVLGAMTLAAQPAAEVRGNVVDARGGEALSNVVAQLVGGVYRATTGSDGRFRIVGVAPGEYTLNVSTVGYRLVKKAIHLDAGETKDFEVILSPETFRQTETVEVQDSPFEPARQDSPSALVFGRQRRQESGERARRRSAARGAGPAGSDFEQRFRRAVLTARRRLQPHRSVSGQRAAALAVPHAGRTAGLGLGYGVQRRHGGGTGTA